MVLIILLLVKAFIIYVSSYTTKFSYFPLLFLNVDNLSNIENRLLKFSVLILDTIVQGTVSHFFYLGPDSGFM